MQDNGGTDEGRSLVSNWTMEIIVALVLLAGCAIVIVDSTALSLKWPATGTDSWLPEVKIDLARFGWQEGLGPGPGYFPFWVAVILGISSLINLANAVRGYGAGQIFVAIRPFGRVLAVLLPSLVYVALIGGLSLWSVPSIGILEPIRIPGLGIYVASAIFIFAFMIVVGRENLIKAVGVSVGVPVALFFMFEKWFLVPLPKGPLEAWLLGM
jgi:putative tricarboxylic transport membrane protein